MIVGSVMVTLMALVIGVPLAIAAAIFLAEACSRSVQAVVRPVVQLLAGIPSVVYGLFGMVVPCRLFAAFRWRAIQVTVCSRQRLY